MSPRTSDGAPVLTVAVVLPAYNEEGNLTPLIGALMQVAANQPFTLKVIVVDDGSRDGTAAELAAIQPQWPTVEVVRHATNLGLARALKSGIAAAIAGRSDAAVFMDSDLSHAPEDVPKLIAELMAGADVAIGSRFIKGGGMRGVPLWRVSISRAGNGFGRAVLRVPMRDLTSGFRAVRRHVLETIVLAEDAFTIQLESVLKAYAAGFTVVEVPIVLGTRRHGVSHMRYSGQLFRQYWRLLMSGRRWIRPTPP